MRKKIRVKDCKIRGRIRSSHLELIVNDKFQGSFRGFFQTQIKHGISKESHKGKNKTFQKLLIL